MATVTPNFNWPVPTSTDLVKDGATAIEALGDSIDGSLVDLKGGTTGQVLSKTSGTDMDFTWVTTDDANAIQNSIVDAKGDLISATANDTPARLAVGANGETLVADSSATTGLRYQASQAAGKNAIINGGMDIWQRGTSVTGSGGYNYTADRWEGFLASTYTVSQVDVSSVLNNFQYGLRAQRASGQTTTNYFNIEQGLETETIQPLRGNVVTVSFWARCGANFSAASSQMLVTLYAGTGTERVRNVTAYTNETTPINTVATLTTTYQKFTFTSTAIPTTTTQMAWTFASYPTGTAGANDWFEVTGVQIEVGSVATAFTRAGGTIQGELAACQRYFQIIAEGNSAYIFNGNNWYAFDVRGVYTFPVQMRTAPTLVGTTGTNYYRVQYNTTTDDLNEIKMSSATVRNCLLLNDTQAAVTAGTPATVLTNNAAASVAISAEL